MGPAATVTLVSIFSAESELRRARATLEDARKRQAAEDKKAADADKAAATKEASARRTSSASTQQSYLRDAQRKRDDANKARTKAADHSGKAATAQVQVHRAEQKLAVAKAAEEKKRDDASEQARKKREADEQRQRQEADRAMRRAADENARAERARQVADTARDRQVAELEAQLADARATLESRPWDTVPEQITVLVITAQPNGVPPLRIDREIRQIQEQVRSSELRDSITFEYRPATRVTDLLQHLNEVAPDVIHFSGHGEDAGIVLHDVQDRPRLLSDEDLRALLAVAPRRLKLVVLNACNSADQARVAIEHVDAAVGMTTSILDESARVFAGQLYNSLGFGRSLGLAFDQAKLQVQLTFNALSGDPTLAVADGLDANDIIIVSPAEPTT
jgi:hypothetical protein